MHVVAPEKVSTCRSKSAEGEWIGKVYGKISQMEVVEDFESRLHRAVSFPVEREREMQEWNEQKLPKALPGKSGGRLPRKKHKRKKAEKKGS